MPKAIWRRCCRLRDVRGRTLVTDGVVMRSSCLWARAKTTLSRFEEWRGKWRVATPSQNARGVEHKAAAPTLQNKELIYWLPCSLPERQPDLTAHLGSEAYAIDSRPPHCCSPATHLRSGVLRRDRPRCLLVVLSDTPIPSVVEAPLTDSYSVTPRPIL